MARKPSLKTVAEAAGVSPSTVSNAYNKPDHLSTDVRERIFAIALEQGYAGPDPAARSLRSRRSGAIGVLFTLQLSYAFSDPYCVELLTGIAEIAERGRTSVLLMPLAPRVVGHAESQEEVRQSVEAVRHAVIDGAIADGIDDGHPALQVLTSRGLPLIRSVDDPDGRCVIIEERVAARAVGEHLRRLGHTDIAVVVDNVGRAGSVGNVAEVEAALYPYSRLRLAGVRDGVGGDATVTVVAAGPNAAESGRTAAGGILELSRRPTAIVATTDVLALGVLAELRQRRLTAGRHISVTGFDDIPEAAAAGLTTVRQPVLDKGRFMGRMLLDPSFVQRRVVLPTTLVVRDSTGPVATA